MKHSYRNTACSIAAGILLLALMALQPLNSFAQLPVNPQPVEASGLAADDYYRCGSGQVTLVATVSTTFDAANIRWYRVPFYGDPITEEEAGVTIKVAGQTSTLAFTRLENTETFFVDYVDDDECAGCDRVMVTAYVTRHTDLVQPDIYYENKALCTTFEGTLIPILVGPQGGNFSIEPAASGFDFDTQTGVVTFTGSATADDYTIKYDAPSRTNCAYIQATFPLTVNTPPTTVAISYTPHQICAKPGAADINVVFDPLYDDGILPAGAFFSSTPRGLVIDRDDGTIDASKSLTGEYTITYIVPGGGGCAPFSTTTTVEVQRFPTAVISYNDPFTVNQSEQQVTLTGTDAYTGGDYGWEAIGGHTGTLSLNTGDGEITPSESDPGLYTVTYTVAGSGFCAGEGDFVASTRVEILKPPLASLSVDEATVCQGDTRPVVTFTGLNGTAPYFFEYTVNDGDTRLAISPAGQATATVSQPTAVPGDFIYKIVKVTDITTGFTQYATDTPTLTVTVLPAPIADFDYPGSPFCSDLGSITPTFLGGGFAGTFSYEGSGTLSITASTGEIHLADSDTGTYTITNTIAAEGGCPLVDATVVIDITRLPLANFEYDDTEYCRNAENPLPVFAAGAVSGTFTADPPDLIFVDAFTGEINLRFSPPGTYSVTNTIDAAGGCGAVSYAFSVNILTTTFADAGQDMVVCAGDFVELGGPEEAGVTYAWYKGAGATGTVLSASSTLSVGLVTETSQYTLWVKNTASGCEDVATVSITVKPVPDARTITGPATFCPPTTTDVTYQYTANGAAATDNIFIWDYIGTGTVTPAVTFVIVGGDPRVVSATFKAGSRVSNITLREYFPPEVGGVSGCFTYTSLDGIMYLNEPIVDIETPTEITATSAKLGLFIDDLGGTIAQATKYGFIYSTDPDLDPLSDPAGTTTDVYNDSGPFPAGTYSLTITDLSPGTTYYYYGYAENCAGTGYTVTGTFTTLITKPTVTTGNVTNISETTATVEGDVTADGGGEVTARGVEYSTTENFTAGTGTPVAGTTGTGSYTVSLTGLVHNTTYYVRAYATSAAGTGYGEQKSFTTPFVCGTSDVTWTYNGTEVTYGTVEIDYGGSIGTRCWLDRNLGASQVANSSTDANAYGDLFQWGRGDDGHQVRDPLSGTTEGPTTESNPGSNFITLSAAGNWYNGTDPQPNDLWKENGTGTNNPCPPGWRVPTHNELDEERKNWGSNNSAGAYASTLKWPVGGYRRSTGELHGVDIYGRVWSSSVSSTGASTLSFISDRADMDSLYPAEGVSVRCVRD